VLLEGCRLRLARNSPSPYKFFWGLTHKLSILSGHNNQGFCSSFGHPSRLLLFSMVHPKPLLTKAGPLLHSFLFFIIFIQRIIVSPIFPFHCHRPTIPPRIFLSHFQKSFPEPFPLFKKFVQFFFLKFLVIPPPLDSRVAFYRAPL